MNLIPSAITRKIAEQGLLASENAPKILFVGGVVGMVGSTVLACRATLKLEEVLDGIETVKSNTEEVKHMVDSGQTASDVTYSDAEYKRDLHIISVQGVGKIVKLYAPSVILGAASIAALTKSHNILRDRNLALTAAYTAVDAAFNRYRQRVVDMFGEEMDQDIYYETERVDVVDEETGKVTTVDRVIGAPGSIYSRFYDEQSSDNWRSDPEVNMLFLTAQQNYLNDKLKSRGHMFLNEVYDALGLSHTKAGAVVGWRWNKGSGDDCIDFGCWDGDEPSKRFFNGREGAILLDFNVDGLIQDKIEETGY
jgi:hypothetical protein